ncbi:MAG: electron transport complex subunit RsxC [Bacteroidetes bacterium]|nr:electron transport complex subunit RsxC [Bacteroidota bacterium]
MKTFKIGGVHPEENKTSANQPIKVVPVSKIVFIPVSQHLGNPAKPLVEKGEIVKTGQLIAKGDGFISANVHSSVSGKVLKVEEVIDYCGIRRQSIVIETTEDVWDESIDTSTQLITECTLNSDAIIEKINEKGIVGLGGATFPSYVKYKIPEGKKPEVLIINGVECEPYLTADHRLMLEKSREIMVGITILMKGLKVNKAMIGIENNKPDAIAKLSSLTSEFPGISVHALKVKYPQGAEKQLIKALINREVPSGKLPMEVGCVVQNVGTAFAVYEAIQKNKPLFERVVTVSGKALSKPSNLLVRVGTPIIDLIDIAGGIPEDTGKIIIGGPMMGRAASVVDAPITKATSGILVMTKKESKRIAPVSCIRCGKCITVCPMGLEPYLLAKLSEAQMWEEAEDDRIMDCMECGSCQFTCPSARPLVDYMRVGKNKVGQIIRNRKN